MAEWQFHGPDKRFLVAVMPDVFTGSALGRFLPSRTIVEEHTRQDKGTAAAVVEIEVGAVPVECFCSVQLDWLVPTEVADGQGVVKVPVEPLPVFGSVRKSRIEIQADDNLATDIFDAHIYAGRIEAQELHRARWRR